MTEDNSEMSRTAVAKLGENYDDAVVGLKQRRSEFAVGGTVLVLWLLKVGNVVTFPIAEEAITAGAVLALVLAAMSDKSAFSDRSGE